MSRSVYFALRRFYDRYPPVRPFMRLANRLTLRVNAPRPITFSGWGMQTEHALPWETDDPGSAVFRESDRLVRQFEFAPGTYQPRQKALDQLRWRHWMVSWAVDYALRFSAEPTTPVNLVECGVGVGLTTYFALRQAEWRLQGRDFRMHLYDSFAPMRADELLPSESWLVGAFPYNSLDRTKRNLREFEEQTVYHVGYIPETFARTGPHPAAVAYVYISLASALPELAACEFFLHRMTAGGLILLDNYGHPPFPDVRTTLSRYLRDKPGLLLLLPSGQALFFVGG